MAFRNKPKALICYICGREYGTKSLPIHQKRCIEMWKKQESLKPKRERRPLPKPPQEITSMSMKNIDEFNEAAYNKWESEMLEPCPNCGRTFLPDRLPIHLRSCAPDHIITPLSDQAKAKQAERRAGAARGSNTMRKSADSAPRVPVRPKAVACYICGREYGTKSIGIHIPQCIEKWEKQEAQKPKRERRPVPQPPAELKSTNMDDLEAYNAKVADNWNENVLVKCENCGRSFLPDRLEIHARSCKPGNVKTPLSQTIQEKKLKAKAQTEREPELAKTTALPKTSAVTEQPEEDEEDASPPTEIQNRRPSAAPSRQAEEDEDDIPLPTIQSGGAGATTSGGPPEDAPAGNLVPCTICGRKFLEERLAKHETICQKTASKKRKVFNMSGQRATNEAKAAQRKAPRQEETKKPKAVPLWKQQHQDFINNIKYSRKIQAVQEAGGDIRSVEPPKQSVDPYSDYITCPHCQRRFNQTAGERHIPNCANTVNKPKPPPQRRGQQTPVMGSKTQRMTQSHKDLATANAFGNSQKLGAGTPAAATASTVRIRGTQRKRSTKMSSPQFSR